MTEGFEIQPIPHTAIRDVARFLQKWRTNRDEEGPGPRSDADDIDSTERGLQWLLGENPLTRDVPEHGYCIRDQSGAIRGLDVSFPAAFLVEEQRLLGLCSGAFFVEPEARTLGIYLFKRYLASPGYSFFFATTCNKNSGPVWKAVGGFSTPNCEAQHILPLRLEVMLPALLSARTSSRVAAGIVGALGRTANPVLKLLTRKSTSLSSEACQDWEKLSELARRHRPKSLITSERSEAFLQWRYAANSPNHPIDIRVFRDARGNEGWFSLGRIVRGKRSQIRGCILLDAVWPRATMAFETIFPEILRSASASDAIFFQPRQGVDYGVCSPWIIARRGVPRIFAVTPKGSTRLNVSLLDLVPADGDSAFRISAAGQTSVSSARP